MSWRQQTLQWRRNMTHLCAICRYEATGEHHITPVSDGGKTVQINLVWLCKRCHDIVEELQQSGMTFSPHMIQYIRLNYDLGRVCTHTPKCTDMHKHKLVYHVEHHTIKPKVAVGTAGMYCDLCKKIHYPDSNGVIRCASADWLDKHPPRLYRYYPPLQELSDIKTKLIGVSS